MTSRSGSGTVDLNGIRVAGGGGEEGKGIKIVYIQEPIKFGGLLLYINDFALSLVSKLRLGQPGNGLLCYVLSVTFSGLAVLKVMDQKTLVKRGWSYKLRITVFVLNYY